eukprot:CAMPEP_0180429364 /NCGR_PEP_ID=MMETSP1036_2-20121128/7321_1 /TAXON_ID=632150 /ORGANISM="Azadinium spinosum, Strain 3D9" /LENGTH=64 /DNA_ID=CAMNT_0022435043 /DNA_START=57 /DNA_END=248 /DNA_ORIENTATION=-
MPAAGVSVVWASVGRRRSSLLISPLGGCGTRLWLAADEWRIPVPGLPPEVRYGEGQGAPLEVHP